MSDALDQLERSILLSNTDASQQPQTLFDRHPRVYQYSLACLALLGYSFIFGLPVVTLLIASLVPEQMIDTSNYLGVSLILLEIATALLTASLSIALFQLKISLPSGRPITAEDSPKLFALIHELNLTHSGRRFQPKIQQIKLSQNFEIKIVRTPRNGFPLFFTNTLIIGLPLLQTHSPKHIKILILRQIVHLSGARSRLSSWLCYASSYWSQYSIALKKQGRTPSFLLLLFFAWYAPLYKLMAKGTRSLECYFIDKHLSKTLGKQSFAETLVQTFFAEKFLKDIFWPQLNNKAYRHKSPPYLPYSNIEKILVDKLDDFTRQSWLDNALSDKKQLAIKLSLLSRLHNLQINHPTLPSSYSMSAANYFLSDSLKTLITQMNRVWASSSKFDWKKKFLKGQSELAELKELGIQADQGILSDDRMQEYMKFIQRYMSDDESMALYRKILKFDTQDPRISFKIGSYLLEHLKSDGVDALEKTLKIDSSFTLTVCQILTRYYTRIGDNRAAQSCRRRALAYQVDIA